MSVRFGQKLLLARKRAGRTQAALARLMGLKSASSISLWERGKVDPEKASVRALITALRCQPGDLIDDIGSLYEDLRGPQEVPTPEQLLLSDEETGLVTTWRNLDPAYKTALLTLLPAFRVASTHKRRRPPATPTH